MLNLLGGIAKLDYQTKAPTLCWRCAIIEKHKPLGWICHIQNQRIQNICSGNLNDARSVDLTLELTSDPVEHVRLRQVWSRRRQSYQY